MCSGISRKKLKFLTFFQSSPCNINLMMYNSSMRVAKEMKPDGRTTIEMPRDLANRVRIEALKRNIYFRDMMKIIVTEWLENEEGKSS